MKSFQLLQKLVLIVLLSSAVSHAQNPSYSCYITNESLVSPTVYQFDIYLLSTGNVPMQYAAGQWGITVNPTVSNSGILTASVLPGSTALANTSQANTTAQLPVQTFTFNVAAKAPPGTGNGSIISTVNGGCSSPGTKVATCRITNTVPFARNTTMDHAFEFTSGMGKTATKVYAYVNGINTDVTPNGTFYAYNTPGTCLTNSVLNPDVNTGVKNITASGDLYMNVYPNPVVSGTTTLIFNSKSSAHYRLTLIDSIDREVQTEEGTSVAGQNSIKLNLKNVAKGIYMMNLKMDGHSGMVRTVIQ